jgi:hypothetical protein
MNSVLGQCLLRMLPTPFVIAKTLQHLNPGILVQEI